MSAADETALANWLAEDARHARAFANCEKAWAELPKLRHLPAEKLAALLHPPCRRRRSWPAWTAGLAGAAAVVVFLHAPSSPEVSPEVPGIAYAAGATAEARFTLPDGSIADLHRDSEIRLLEGGPAAPVVRLVRGEAHFTIAKKSAGKFVVRVAGMAVRDLGTAFDVQLEPERVTILVTEGRVAFAMKDDAAAPRIGVAGEVARIAIVGETPAFEIHSASEAEFGDRMERNRVDILRRPSGPDCWQQGDRCEFEEGIHRVLPVLHFCRAQ